MQLDPSNQAISVRVLSPGSNGDVSQSNSNTALAAALNGNKTDQDIDQTQGGKDSKDSRGSKDSGHGSDYLQVAGQSSKNVQSADADAFALQKGASNENAPVSVLSKDGHGKGSKGGQGDVTQSNSNTALAAALNGNKTDQDIDQTQGGTGSYDMGSRDGSGYKDSGKGSDYLQIAGQESKNAQWADADALRCRRAPRTRTRRCGCSRRGAMGTSRSRTATRPWPRR